MDKKKRTSNIYLIVIFLSLCITALFIAATKDGMSVSTAKGVKTYNNINKLIDGTSFELDVPQFILDYNKEFIITNTMGQIAEISCEDFSFKAASFVNINADPLGLYEKSTEDVRYNVNDENTKINYFRLRTGYTEYPNCTLLNWCTDKTAYGIIIGNKLTIDEAIELIGISKQSLSEIEKEIGIISENNIDTVQYILEDKVYIELPKLNSNINIIENNGASNFYLDKKLILVVLYNELDIDTEAYSGQSEIVTEEGIVIKYLSENPFSEGTTAYNDYNKFISTIDNITNSIRYQ